MAIYLHTGAPGSGKTLMAVQRIYETFHKQGREIYVLDLDGQLPGVNVHTLTDRQFDWRDLPDGSVVVIDECHKTWPARKPGTHVNPIIMALSEHRHRGFDFLLITQHPKKIDIEVVRLVTDHYHYVRSSWRKSSRVYYSTEFIEHFGSLADRSKEVQPWPTQYFGSYMSSSVQEGKRNTPNRNVKLFFGLIALLVCVVLFGFYFFSGLVPTNDDFDFDDVGGGAFSANSALYGATNLYDYGLSSVDVDSYTCVNASPVHYLARFCARGYSCIGSRCRLMQSSGISDPIVIASVVTYYKMVGLSVISVIDRFDRRRTSAGEASEYRRAPF